MRNAVKVTTRVGKISYINALPFYHGLVGVPVPLAAQQSATSGTGGELNLLPQTDKAHGLEFYESYPTKINLAMRRGKLDIAPVSSLEYLNHQKDYLILPDLAIGARDFSGSVLLISREKIEGLGKLPIALSRQSLSSVALVRILLKLKYKIENDFVPYDESPAEILEKYPAALVIGDQALFFRPKEFVYKYDLSELWWNWTEKPFSFALWVVRREFAEDHPEEVNAFYHRVKKNLETNLRDLETLLKESLDMTFIDDRFPKVFGYLFNLNYGFDGAMREGLELFYRLAWRLRLAPRPKKLEFFDIA